MLVLRHFLLTNRRCAALFVALALAMKLLTPTGYMFAQSDGRITVTLCPSAAPVPAPHAMSGMSKMSAMAGMDHKGDHGSSSEHGKPEMPCAFAGIGALALGAVDALVLAAALAFVAIRALRPVRARRALRLPYLRPPLRGPPIRL